MIKGDIQDVYKGKFVTLRTVSTDDYEYEYLHEHRCDGDIVAFVIMDNTRDAIIARNEYTPCWGDDLNVSSFTGGVENGNSPEETVVIEAKEEAGIDITTDDIFSLGKCKGTKSSDTTYHLFFVDSEQAVNLDGGEGDGGVLENKAVNVLLEDVDANDYDDPILSTIILRTLYFGDML